MCVRIRTGTHSSRDSSCSRGFSWKAGLEVCLGCDSTAFAYAALCILMACIQTLLLNPHPLAPCPNTPRRAATREVVTDIVSYASEEEGIDLMELRFSPAYMGGGPRDKAYSVKGRGEYPTEWDDHMYAVLQGCAVGAAGRRCELPLFPAKADPQGKERTHTYLGMLQANLVAMTRCRRFSCSSGGGEGGRGARGRDTGRMPNSLCLGPSLVAQLDTVAPHCPALSLMGYA